MMCVVYVWERRISKMDKHMSVEIAERDEERNTLHKMEWLKIKRCHCKPYTSTILCSCATANPTLSQKSTCSDREHADTHMHTESINSKMQ